MPFTYLRKKFQLQIVLVLVFNNAFEYHKSGREAFRRGWAATRDYRQMKRVTRCTPWQPSV